MTLRIAEEMAGIQGHEDLVRKFGLRSHPWGAADIDDFRFDDNVDGIARSLEFRQNSFVGVLECYIVTTFDGVSNGDFHRSVARRLAKLTGPRVILNIEFVAEDAVGPLQFSVGKRIIAFEAQRAGDAQVDTLIIEPDRARTMQVGLDFMG